jgi:hypothetical protein
MNAVNLSELTVLSVFAVLLLGGLAAVALSLRWWVRRRLKALEENLRTYATVNAAMGRHLTTLESELKELGTRLQAQQSEARRPGPAGFSRGNAPRTTNEEFTEAELRFAQRLKAGLSSMRLG